MSYLFDASSERLDRTASVPITGLPLTIGFWAKITELDQDGTFMVIGQNGSNNNQCRVKINTSENSSSITSDASTSTVVTTSGTEVDATNWFYYLLTVADGTNLQIIYVNGTDSSNTGTPKVPGTFDAIVLGRSTNSADPVLARIGQAAIWDTALSSANADTLAAGAVPSSVAPGSCVAYWPLTVDATDSIASFDLTVNGATFDGGDNPPVSSGSNTDILVPTGPWR